MKVLRNKESEANADWTVWFEDFYNVNYEKFFRYAYAITKSKPLAEDVVSDVVMMIWKKKPNLKKSTDLIAYMTTSIKHLAIKVHAQQSKKQGIDSELTDPLKVPDPQSVLLGKELERVIQDVFEQLTPHEKLVYDMARNKGMSHEQIAAELGISKHTAQKHLSNVLREFRTALLKRFPSSEPGHFYLSKQISISVILLQLQFGLI